MSLEKSFAFYGSYHSNSVNKFIHLVCVPVIFTTSIEILNRFVFKTFIQTLVIFYALSFIRMHALAGIMYAPIIFGMYYLGISVLPLYPMHSLILFIGSWIAQFIGHGIFEKRSPALLKNLPQSLHAAVFFVWLELLFIFGFEPSLKHKLDELISKAQKKL